MMTAFSRRNLIAGAALGAAALRANAAPSGYGKDAAQLIGAALVDTQGMERLIHLCDRIGARLAGSQALQRAVEWSAREMRASRLENVATPEVAVPVWIRGAESVEMLAPQREMLPMLGLGGSVATPPEGIEAEVLVVRSFEELEQTPRERVAGRIVLFNPEWEGYGSTVRYRMSGASRAAEMGAVAALIRSVTPVSLQTPHTGALRYDVDIPKIPAAALTVEDAARLERLTARGVAVRLRLRMEARSAPDAMSANVVGEIPGREAPQEVVVMGGHLDSWDVGQGAQDDGSGCMAALQAVHLVKMMGLRPRRTLRVCFWTNEENGLRGGNAYRAWAESRGEKHVAAIEMDGGAERPLGFGIGMRGQKEGPRALDGAVKMLQPIGALLDGIGAGAIRPGGGGADISPLMNAGVPGLGLRTVGEKYFHWHHTNADTVDKVDLQDFRKCIAALAVMGFVLADREETLV